MSQHTHRSTIAGCGPAKFLLKETHIHTCTWESFWAYIGGYPRGPLFWSKSTRGAANPTKYIIIHDQAWQSWLWMPINCKSQSDLYAHSYYHGTWWHMYSCIHYFVVSWPMSRFGLYRSFQKLIVNKLNSRKQYKILKHNCHIQQEKHCTQFVLGPHWPLDSTILTALRMGGECDNDHSGFYGMLLGCC